MVPLDNRHPKTPRPLFSVLTPVFNGAQWIERCIESIAAQDFPHLEMLIVDDGSTDETPTLLEKYKSIYGWLRIIRQANHGYCFTMNRLVREARGLFAIGVDSDNYLSANAMRECAAVINECPDIEIIQMGRRAVSSLDPIIQPSTSDRLSYEIYRSQDKILKAILSGKICHLSHGCKAIRCELLAKQFFCGYPFGSDERVMERLLIEANAIAFLPSSFLAVSIRPDSLSHAGYPKGLFHEWISLINDDIGWYKSKAQEWGVPLISVTCIWMAYRYSCKEECPDKRRRRKNGLILWKNREAVFGRSNLRTAIKRWFICHFPGIAGFAMRHKD